MVWSCIVSDWIDRSVRIRTGNRRHTRRGYNLRNRADVSDIREQRIEICTQTPPVATLIISLHRLVSTESRWERREEAHSTTKHFDAHITNDPEISKVLSTTQWTDLLVPTTEYAIFRRLRSRKVSTLSAASTFPIGMSRSNLSVGGARPSSRSSPNFLRSPRRCCS